MPVLFPNPGASAPENHAFFRFEFMSLGMGGGRSSVRALYDAALRQRWRRSSQADACPVPVPQAVLAGAAAAWDRKPLPVLFP